MGVTALRRQRDLLAAFFQAPGAVFVELVDTVWTGHALAISGRREVLTR